MQCIVYYRCYEVAMKLPCSCHSVAYYYTVAMWLPCGCRAVAKDTDVQTCDLVPGSPAVQEFHLCPSGILHVGCTGTSTQNPNCP